MTRSIKLIIIVFVSLVLISSASAQSTPDLIAPNIFVRGIQLPQGVRYTAAFIKPDENAALQNISVEITLPADAQFTEMLVSRQVQFHVVRKNRQRQLTLIWQISRLAADQPLDSFSFTLAQPLSAELEFYMQWQTAEGEQKVENFFEVPPVVNATQTESLVYIERSDFVFVDDTGVQVSAPPETFLTARVLPLNFNPPPEYGNIWWCSLLELRGLAPESNAEVIMPLRRSLAPFTALQLFQQQADGSWAALEGQGIVTADGQYVMYTHPGGVVATGGPAEIQPDALPASEIVIVEEPAVPPPADNPPPAGEITDGTSNTIIIGEVAAAPTTVPYTAVPNTAVPNTAVPNTPVPNTAMPNTAVPNTLVPNTPVPNTAVPNTPVLVTRVAPTSTAGGISDGTSNTIIIGEARTTPTVGATVGVLPTVAASTVIATFAPSATPIGGISDGTSNTISNGETRIAPTVGATVGVLPTVAASTVIATFAPSATPIGGISDGTSNTIIVGEANVTATLVGATAVATGVPPTASPAPTIRPAATIVTAPPVIRPIFSPSSGVINIQPFGAGGVRVEILTTSAATLLQCQAGKVNCSVLIRQQGAGKR